MKVYPKEDIKNVFGQIIWYKSKVYECTRMAPLAPGFIKKDDKMINDMHSEHYVVTCELYANEYPIMTGKEVIDKFYTIEDQRDIKIGDILK